MKKKFIVISILILVLIVGMLYYFNSGGEDINKNIPGHKTTAKQLVEISKPFVEKYWGNRSYHVGAINMELDKSEQGNVEIWYKDEKKNNDGVPNIITVEIDTKNKKVLRIINQDRDSKIEPGNINIEKWAIDSREAIKMANEAFKGNSDFDYTIAYLSGTNSYLGGKETWDVSLFNKINKKAYYLKIDAYTGDIYRKEVK